MKEGFRNLASAMIWTKSQKHVVSTTLSVFDEKEKLLYVGIPQGTDPDWFMKELAALGSNDCYFSVSLSRANIFFKARYVGHNTGGFLFSAPDAIYKVQRRKDTRLLVPFGHIIKLEIQDPVFPEERLSKKIFDISASGLSFIVSDNEAALFQTGLQLAQVSFSIGSRKINVIAEVRHARPQPAGSSNPGFKVGILFKTIQPGDAQWIAAYIFEESRKVVTRFCSLDRL